MSRDAHFTHMRLDHLVAKVDLFAGALKSIAAELAARGLTLAEAREAVKDPARAAESGVGRADAPREKRPSGEEMLR